MKEIEHKYLINKENYPPFSWETDDLTSITQVYALGLRFRQTFDVMGFGNTNKSYLTYKGKASASGLSRTEIEFRIPNFLFSIVNLFSTKRVRKSRRVIDTGYHRIEIDHFHEPAFVKGMILAEIEVPSETHLVVKPDWLGEEVTGNKNYDNYTIALQGKTK